jgi:hypothetical protein
VLQAHLPIGPEERGDLRAHEGDPRAQGDEYAAYTTYMPPVHAKALRRNTVGKMLNDLYHILFYFVSGLYLLRLNLGSGFRE